MPQRLFIFVQMEFPWVLGPPDARYLLRSEPDGEPERVVVFNTLATGRAGDTRERSGSRVSLLGRARGRGSAAEVAPEPEPEAVASTRVSVIDPVSLSAENQARAWLENLDPEHDVLVALTVINRVLHAHRIAAADPYVHEVSPAQALTIRAGWGEGEQVADGRWLYARELSWKPHGRGSTGLLRGGRARSIALRPQERLAELLGARSSSLLCEELALRARLDIDQNRPLHAAVELDRALALAASELRDDARQDLAIRIAELEQLHPGVSEQTRLAAGEDAAQPDLELLTHALGRLEAALRARSASGFSLR